MGPTETAGPYERAERSYPWMMDVFDALVDTNVFWFR